MLSLHPTIRPRACYGVRTRAGLPCYTPKHVHRRQGRL